MRYFVVPAPGLARHAFKGPDIVRFLKHLLHHLAGKPPVIWGSAPIHRCGVVKDFLAAGAAERLHLEALPAYAPDVNPVAGIWHYLKRVELRNRRCHDLAELKGEFRRATARLHHQLPILKASIQHAGYQV